MLNAYSRGDAAGKTDVYKDGDFVIHFAGCDGLDAPDCEAEAEPFSRQWRTIFNALR
jgi:mannan polymerase II complex MNN11 subunit